MISGDDRVFNGLTKREYFAAMVMQGLVAGYTDRHKVNGRFIASIDYRLLAEESTEITDVLIEQLNKPKDIKPD